MSISYIRQHLKNTLPGIMHDIYVDIKNPISTINYVSDNDMVWMTHSNIDLKCIAIETNIDTVLISFTIAQCDSDIKWHELTFETNNNKLVKIVSNQDLFLIWNMLEINKIELIEEKINMFCRYLEIAPIANIFIKKETGILFLEFMAFITIFSKLINIVELNKNEDSIYEIWE